MSGAYINLERLKEFLDSQTLHPDHRYIVERNRILNTCTDRGESIKRYKINYVNT